MSTYRYVVFPHGRQPTVEEVRQLKEFAGALANQFAWGTCRRDGRLAIAFDQQSFDHVLGIDPGFESLIRRWEVRGCELADHLAFIKDSSALRPVSAGPAYAHAERESVATPHTQDNLADKHSAAQEAVARSLLGVERTLQQYAVLERFAAAAPYFMMVIAIIGLIAVGLYLRQRLQSPERENRQQTIERVLDESANEPPHTEVAD